MADIFLSYAEEDRELARKIVTLLESAGWSVWWDRRIPAGKTWRTVLDTALAEMRCMLVLWSQRSVTSDWVIEEAEEARSRGKLLPLLMEKVLPPRGFREIQALDFSEWDRSSEAACFRLLLEDLESCIGKPNAPMSAVSRALETTAREAVRIADEPVRNRADVNLSAALPQNAVNTGADNDLRHRSDHSEHAQSVEDRGVRIASSIPPRLVAWGVGGVVIVGALIGIFHSMTPRQDSNSVTDVPNPATSVVPAVTEPSRRMREQVSDVPPATSAKIPNKTVPEPATVSGTASSSAAPATHKATRIGRADGQAASSQRNTESRPARCTDVLARGQLGEALSVDDRAFLQKECK